jgi:hypothetical protein
MRCGALFPRGWTVYSHLERPGYAEAMPGVPELDYGSLAE